MSFALGFQSGVVPANALLNRTDEGKNLPERSSMAFVEIPAFSTLSEASAVRL